MNVRASVILPTFNGEKYLEATIRGILSQTFRSFEVFIFDDGSSDSTVEVIRDLTSERPSLFKVRLHRENRGVCEMISNMLEMCEGEIIFWLGQDDVWADGYLSAMVAALDLNPNAVAAFAEITIIDGSGKILEPAMFKHERLEGITRHQVFSKLLAGNFLCAPGSAFRRSSASSAMLGVNNERLQDFELWLNLIQSGDFIQATGARCSYRIHQTNLSNATRGRNQAAYETFACFSRILLSENCDDFIRALPEDQRDNWIIESTNNMLKFSRLNMMISPLVSAWLERLQQNCIGSASVLRALRAEIALGMQLFRKSYQLKEKNDSYQRYTCFKLPLLKNAGVFDHAYFDYLLSLGVFRDGRILPEDASGRVIYIGTADSLEESLSNADFSAAVERGDVIVTGDGEARHFGNCLRLPARFQALSDSDTNRIVGHLEDTVQMGLPPYLATHLDSKLERKIVLRFFWKKIKRFIPAVARTRIKKMVAKWADA